MEETYRYHRRVLRLLQWHCGPTLWHLKTPVHMFALDALVEAYPNARFLWSHRDPSKVIGSVCSLIHYTRSWSSDRDDSFELGAEQLDRWWVAVRRAMDFRERMGDERFADVSFSSLQTDPLGALGGPSSRSAFRSTKGHVPRSTSGHSPMSPEPTGRTVMSCPTSVSLPI